MSGRWPRGSAWQQRVNSCSYPASYYRHSLEPEVRRSKHPVWSAYLCHDSYCCAVEIFKTEQEARSYASSRPGWRVVNGTQMWNEPGGQIEEE